MVDRTASPRTLLLMMCDQSCNDSIHTHKITPRMIEVMHYIHVCGWVSNGLVSA